MGILISGTDVAAVVLGAGGTRERKADEGKEEEKALEEVHLLRKKVRKRGWGSGSQRKTSQAEERLMRGRWLAHVEDTTVHMSRNNGGCNSGMKIPRSTVIYLSTLVLDVLMQLVRNGMVIALVAEMLMSLQAF